MGESGRRGIAANGIEESGENPGVRYDGHEAQGPVTTPRAQGEVLRECAGEKLRSGVPLAAWRGAFVSRLVFS